MTRRTDRAELLGAVVVVCAALAFVVDHVAHDDVFYVMWADRDMVRSDVPFAQLPSSGPELWLGWGARIPGGGLHVLWWLALRVLGPSPWSVWAAQWGVFGAGAAALAVAVGRTVGVLPGALAFALAMTATPAVTTLQTLWNPGFTIGLALLATATTVRGLAQRDARWLVPTLLTLALAVQTHLSVGLLGLGLAVVWGVAGPVGAWRWGLGGLGLSLLGWVSYLRDEAATGWANTRLLVAPEQLATLAPGGSETWALRVAEAGRVLDLMFGGCAVWWSPSAVAGAVTAAVVVVVWAVIERRAGPSDEALRLGRIGLWLVALVVAAYVRSSANAGEREAVRYLVAMAGGVPLCGAALLAATSGAARRGMAVVLVGITLTLTWSQHVNVVSERRVPGPAHWLQLASWTEVATARTGWTLAELTGRTVLVQRSGSSDWRRITSVGLAWPLARAGQTFPGSLAPPCALYVEHDVSITTAEWATPDVMSQAVGTSRVVSLDQLIPVDAQRTLVLYTPDTDRCPTSFGARYLVTPEEALTRDPAGAPTVGTAVRIDPDADGRQRWRLAFPLHADGDASAQALLTAKPLGADVELVLHANALRGRGWNYGFFDNAALVGPAVVSRDAAGVELGRVVFTSGVAGGGAALTPLRAVGTLPAGRWTFEAVSDRSRIPDLEHPAPGQQIAVPVAIPLPQ